MQLEEIKKEIEKCSTAADLENIRIKYLGRTGLINAEFSKIKSAPDHKLFGIELNELKKSVEELIETKNSSLGHEIKSIKKNISVASIKKIGHLHPLTITERQLNEVFRKLGFSIYNSPEIVTDEYNFERLNVPKNYPARDMKEIGPITIIKVEIADNISTIFYELK
ncbi:MAG: hypothetical protein WAV41_03810 [Microgenomates group bacterium]